MTQAIVELCNLKVINLRTYDIELWLKHYKKRNPKRTGSFKMTRSCTA